ncbi:Ppx/GppA phosphatase family protein [Clostridium sp. LP20]|uniref:Ppx/GppA phosphatase family protein n=1 Tax=Clostridium sp. LP20 TaxID=3418665 RepID=UPI003EE5E617
MNRVGVIDIGANSVKFMLTEVEEDGYFRIIDELTSSLRLCYDLLDGDEISDKKINETISTLKTFKSLCSVSGANEIIAVATDAFRFARNKDTFIQRIKEELGIDVVVLSAEEEVYYNYLGVINSIYFNNSLLVDIGGSSTHLAWIIDGDIKESVTLPIGTVNLTYKYNLQDRILKEDLEDAITHVQDQLNSLDWLKEGKFDSVIGVGGTLRSLGKINRLRTRYPFDISHNYIMSDLDVHDVYNLVKCKDLKLRRKVEGLSYERSDIIVGGLAIFSQIIDVVHNQSIIISGRGLREGIMYEYINTHTNPITDILDYSINGILESLNINKYHAKNVYWLSTELFEAFKPLHHLSNEYDHILKTAAMLHDCGINIDYYNHHKHTFYIILNSYFNGLTQKELLLSAAVAASHRNNSYHLPLPQFCSIINKLDLKIIAELGVIVRIAESLDRSLEGAVKKVNVIINDEDVTIQVSSQLDLDLEIRQALRCSCKFKEVYNKNLIVEKVEF